MKIFKKGIWLILTAVFVNVLYFFVYANGSRLKRGEELPASLGAKKWLMIGLVLVTMARSWEDCLMSKSGV